MIDQGDAALVGLFCSVLGFALGRLSLRLGRARDAARGVPQRRPN